MKTYLEDVLTLSYLMCRVKMITTLWIDKQFEQIFAVNVKMSKVKIVLFMSGAS